MAGILAAVRTKPFCGNSTLPVMTVYRSVLSMRCHQRSGLGDVDWTQGCVAHGRIFRCLTPPMSRAGHCTKTSMPDRHRVGSIGLLCVIVTSICQERGSLPTREIAHTRGVRPDASSSLSVRRFESALWEEANRDRLASRIVLRRLQAMIRRFYRKFHFRILRRSYVSQRQMS